MTGYRTYASLVGLAIYNVLFPILGIKEINMNELDAAVNVIILILAAIFHKLHKPK